MDSLVKPAVNEDLQWHTRRDETLGTKIWITVGALWLALFVYCMVSWVVGPDFVTNDFGRDQASPGYVLFVRIMESLMLAITAWILYHFVFKPLFRDGKFSFEGLYFLACFTLVLQEPWHSWIRPQLLYNDIFFNMGSWMGYLPVSNPTAHLTPLPIAFAGLGYFWIYGLPAYGGYRLMDRAKAKNPDISTFRLILCCFLGFCIFDFIIESFILRTGLFIYPSTIPELTLFAGETYQYPLYETIAWAGSYTAAAVLLHFRNDKGETVADRGLDGFTQPGPVRTLARWLALVGYLQIGLLVTFNIPYMFYALHGGQFTVTEQSHPWLTAGLCGESTPYACPGPGIPFARLDSPTNRIGVAVDDSPPDTSKEKDAK